MAWNPSPEVAVARDAAKRLDADQCIVVWLNRRTGKMGFASYGRNASLCRDAKRLGDAAYEAVYDAVAEDEEPAP